MSSSNQNKVRTPPQDLEAERAVLSACIQDRTAIEICILMLKPNDFYREIHRIIFGTLIDMYLENTIIEIPSIVTVLRHDGNLEKIGGVVNLTNIMEEFPTTASVKFYAKIVKEKSERRGMLRLLMESTTDLFSETADYPVIRARLFDYIVGYSELNIDSDCRVSDVTMKLFEKLKDVSTGKRFTHCKTGISRFDTTFQGIELSNLSVLVADPKVGKSNFMLQSAINMAESGIGVGYIALDMHTETIMSRMLNYSMSLPMWKLWGQECPLDAVTNKMYELNNLKAGDNPALIIAGQENCSCEALRVIQWIVMAQRKWKLKVFFVDSFSAFEYPQVDGRNDEGVQSSIVNKLKSISFQFDIGIFGAVDKNYEGNAKGTSRWRAGASNIWDFILSEDKKSLKVVSKYIRNGPSGECTLYPNFEYSSFLSEPRR